MKVISRLSVFLLLLSCNQTPTVKKTTGAENQVASKTIKTQPKSHKKEFFKYYKDTCEFLNYNDNYDYWFIEVLSNNQLIAYINDSDTRNLLRGDLIEVTWKYDTIYIAGDGERPEIAKWMVSIKKLKDGNASKFRKSAKKLKYHWDPKEDYSDSYLQDLYLLVEYYIANSKDELIKRAIQSNLQIEYSIEDREKNSLDYTVIGIGTTSENHFSIMKWIFIDRENQSIYEHDLAKDKLMNFD